MRPIHRAVLIFAAIVCFSISGFAQATRTWVSGVGDDANPCSRTAPCKTFAGAISKTAAGGEIDAIDSGGFGAVTITKSITIDGKGVMASILASGTNGIVINAGVNDVVTIRNVSINGATTGIKGIRLLQAKALIVESCDIFQFSQMGISVEVTNPTNVVISNSKLTNIVGNAIFVKAASGTPVARVTVENTIAAQNGTRGVFAGTGAQMTIRHSALTNNATNGVMADGASVDVSIDGCNISSNQVGIFSTNSAQVRLSDSVVTQNTSLGLSTSAVGTIASFGNNYIDGNAGGNGPPSPMIPQQ